MPETRLRQIPEPLEERFAGVTATGARLGVDDFGTGYASLPLLQHAARERGVHRPPPGRRRARPTRERAGLARALIALARGLDFEVVAKGVETHAQRDFLAEAGCRVCQGDLFAPAGPAGEIEPFLRARRAA